MDMLLAKVWYFFYFGGMVCVWPYLNLLYRANGLDDAQIGVLAAIKPWVSAPSSFLWSGIADRFSIHKTILLSTFIVSTLTRASTVVAHSFTAFMVLAAAGEFVAAPVGVMADAAVVAGCKQDTDYGKSRLWGAVAWGGLSTFSGWMVSTYGMPSGFAAYLLLSIPCVFCAWHLEFKLGRKSEQNHHKQQQQQQQQKEAGQPKGQCVIGAESSSSSTVGGGELQQQGDPDWDASDQAGVDVEQQPLVTIEQAGDLQLKSTHLQQQQGQLLQVPPHQQQQQKQGNLYDDLPAQPASGSSSEAGTAKADVSVLADTAVVQSAASPNQQKPHHQHKQQQQHVSLSVHQQHSSTVDSKDTPTKQAPAPTQHPPDFWHSLRLLLLRPEVLIFMGQATSMGFGIGVIGEFLFLFLQELGGSETLMGLTLTFTCLAEVPVFHYQGTVLRYISVHTMLHIVMWTYGIRLGLYALLPYAHTPWAVLPVELLHGITFACGWGAGTINSKRVAPPELAAMMQGIFQGLYFGVGQGLGALIGGLLKERYGGQAMFAMCSAIIMVSWLLVVAAERLTGVADSSSSTDDAVGSGHNAAEGSPKGSAVEGGLQQQEQLGSGGLRLLWGYWEQLRLRLLGMVGLQAFASDAAGSRRWKQVYMELGSKDSGPDLGPLEK